MKITSQLTDEMVFSELGRRLLLMYLFQQATTYCAQLSESTRSYYCLWLAETST